MPNFEAQFGAQPHERLYANQLSEGIRRGKYVYWDRPGAIHLLNCSSPLTALPTAAQGQIDQISVLGAVGNGHLELFQTTAQTLVPTAVTAKGITITGDYTVDNESLELVPGGNRADNPFAYTQGVSPGVFIRATMELTDVSELDQLVVGWRKQESYQVPTSFLSTGDALYTDFAGLGFSGTAVANLVKSITDVNNSGSTLVTSTTFAWADTKIHTLEVRLRKSKAEYLINGVRMGDTVTKDGINASLTAQTTVGPPAYTVGSGLNMIPFIFVRTGLLAAGSTGWLRRLEVGQLLEIGLSPSDRGPQTYYF